ncbi:MAG: glycosyltransferase family 2 protein [Planctomycetota bacterium]|nr:MAG: glycosyltransferase family 2 protein [Planctomycetota bacterium]
MRLRYSVFVPTFRRPELLRRNLEALAVQTRRPDEILVSLRPAEDPEGVAAVDAFAAAHPELKVVPVHVHERGIVVAENALLAAASGDVACFLDDDAIARPFWLEHIARHYERDERVGGVAGPAINVVDGKPQERRARFRNRVIFPGLILDQSTRHTDRVVRVDHYRGANMSLRLAPLRRAGGFDARLRGDCFRFELDACLAVARQGYRLVFDPEVEADHHEAPRGSGNQERFVPATIRNNAANETYVLCKHYGFLGRGAHLVFAFLVGNFPDPGLLWAVAGSLLRPFWPSRYLLGVGALLPAWRGRWLGWRMRRGAAA